MTATADPLHAASPHPFEVIRGDGPVILAQPHGGTRLPAEIAARLNDRGQRLADTDWHIARLFDGLLPEASVVRADFHRYVIDANRDPGGTSLYPGQTTTGLIPETDFDGKPIWTAGAEPGPADAADRIAAFHAPYHAALTAEVARVRARHGLALVFDCHSIRSRIPYLFDGVLPDLNIGTNGGVTCAADLQAATVETCSQAGGYSHVLNGRFKGGWTTRHYGRPQDRVHAIQLEIAQSTYLASEAPPFAYDPDRAARLRPHLARLLSVLSATLLEMTP